MRPPFFCICYTLDHNAINPGGYGVEHQNKIRLDFFNLFLFYLLKQTWEIVFSMISRALPWPNTMTGISYGFCTISDYRKKKSTD